MSILNPTKPIYMEHTVSIGRLDIKNKRQLNRY